MNLKFRLFVIGMLLVITTMAVATQFALTDINYELIVDIPVIPDYGIIYIGSDNLSDGIRLLRKDPSDVKNFKLALGNISTNYHFTYSAAFAIVNEDDFVKDITYIDVFSSTSSYLKIWLHGNKNANANNISNDPTSVLMYDNGTIVNQSNTVAWILGSGDRNASTLCTNTSNREENTHFTRFDETAGVLYSLNNTKIDSGISDYVWVQIELDIPPSTNMDEVYLGEMHIHFESHLTNFY